MQCSAKSKTLDAPSVRGLYACARNRCLTRLLRVLNSKHLSFSNETCVVKGRGYLNLHNFNSTKLNVIISDRLLAIYTRSKNHSLVFRHFIYLPGKNRFRVTEKTKFSNVSCVYHMHECLSLLQRNNRESY